MNKNLAMTIVPTPRKPEIIYGKKDNSPLLELLGFAATKNEYIFFFKMSET